MLLVLLLLLPLAGFFAATAQAQEPRWSADLSVGLANPTGDLGDLHDEGIFGGVSLGYRILSRVTLRLVGGFENLERGGRSDRLGGVNSSQADLWHMTVLAAASLTDRRAAPWEVELGLGAGTTYVVVEEGQTIAARSGHFLTGHGALLVGYRARERLTLFVRIDLYPMLKLDSDFDGHLRKELSIINSLGVRVDF